MYPYLTGAASWLLLTLQTQAFGIRGNWGNLVLSPKLTAGQFAADGSAELLCTAAGRRVRVRYENPLGLEYGAYQVGIVVCGDRQWQGRSTGCVIPKEELPASQGVLELTVQLIPTEGGTNDV